MDTLCNLYGGCTPVEQGGEEGGRRTMGTMEKKLLSTTTTTTSSNDNDNDNDKDNNIPPSAPNEIKDHCSVIIKLVSATDQRPSELYTAHTTWTGFQEMLRIYKMYDFPYTIASSSKTVVPGRKIALSSYPGNLFSTDDFYTISSGLVATETTIDNHNGTRIIHTIHTTHTMHTIHTLPTIHTIESIWGEVKPEAVLTWIRTMTSNRLATDGPSWASTFAQHNSGTYNNEFHVVDYNIFAASQQQQQSDGGEVALSLLPHVLTVIDQMPGHMEISDQTDKLQSTGFWASYNRPGLPYTYENMNYTATIAAYGPHYSHSQTSRAQLFDLLQGSIVDEASLKKVMRFNQWDNEDVPKEIREQMCAAGLSASNAISERGDLTPLSSKCADDVTQQDEGGIDMKYTTAALMTEAKSSTADGGVAPTSIAQSGPTSIAQSGPTYDDQPVFLWSESPFPDVVHTGQPDRWEFPYVTVSWSDEPSSSSSSNNFFTSSAGIATEVVVALLFLSCVLGSGVLYFYFPDNQLSFFANNADTVGPLNTAPSSSSSSSGPDVIPDSV